MKDKGKTPQFTIVLSVEHSEKDLGLCLDSLANLDYRKDEYRIAAVECGAVPEIGRFLKDIISWQFGLACALIPLLLSAAEALFIAVIYSKKICSRKPIELLRRLERESGAEA